MNATIVYTIEADDRFGIETTWRVPYFATVHSGRVIEVEADGMPTLERLVLRVGAASRELDVPDGDEIREWRNYWYRHAKLIEADLLTRFSADAESRHWDAKEAA
jgi:hypothetical protein